jgi:hypothetical protein
MDWGAFYSTLIGAGISLVASLAMFGLAQFVERRRRDKERKRTEAMEAFVGLHKLMKTLNSIENLARHIDTEFRENQKGYAGEGEPSSIVRQIVGSTPNIEDLTAQELVFVSGGNGELPAQILELQERARNNNTIVQHYNKLKEEFRIFLEANSDALSIKEGNIASIEFEGKAAVLAELKVGEMNQLLGGLIETLEEDRLRIRRVAESYIAEAVKKFRDDFPAKRLEIKEVPNADP